ncbi:DNA-binding transcriptional LysR family regulator [Actinoalloteichus hoggarensis]|uniref:HTH-type transcriptional regulator GltC n=1 Tax=Actinoalloteichus hoggarensis TaxID=1470176 RepID=A0A221W1X5_9PSEU|nr:LysR family transcriptional regulator [Actinoalloteichus hoggarensis]ASO19810.1 HTH-type transcriptional regulator GltC [Actinoalloteichus hoggarensis]MBB5919482.1 DNA-binding transcriptional LysR family regulator [Actinoalloteichus hoggarensis]
MLDVRRMLVLRAVVTSGSMTEAATNLGYTPSAVSQQVATLEREAGIPLLERVGRGVRPTAAGRLLTEHAAVISRDLAEAESALAALRTGRTARLTVRYFATAGVALMPPALARLRREHPGVRVDLTLADPEDPLPAVERGEADLAVIVSGGRRPRDGVRLVPLHDDPYRAVLPKGHPLAARRVLDLADLADESWVGTEQAGLCLDVLLDACAAAGFSPRFGVESDDYATAQGFIAAGMGVGLIPRLGLGNRHPGVVVRRVRRPEPIRSIYAAVRETAATGAALRALVDALRAATPE